MQEERLVAGLDIGTTKVCCVLGRMNEFNNLDVLGVGVAPNEGCSRGLVTNIDKTVFAIQKAVKAASDSAGVDIKVVNVSLAGQYIQSCQQRGSMTRPSSEDEITVADVRRLSQDMFRTVIPHGNKIIHVMPLEYSVDYEGGIKDPVGMTGVRIEADYHIVFSHVNAVNSIMKAVKKADLEIDQIMLSPLASSLACLTEEEKEMGVALVDIGGGTTDVSVFFDNVLRHTAVIPYGGNIITQDIKAGCNVMLNQAEQLKTRFGVALADEANVNEIITMSGLRSRAPREISRRNLAHIVEARMMELIELIHAELIMSGFEDKLGAGIVITGGGALLAKVRYLFEYMTGQECKIGYPNEFLSKPRFEFVKDPQCATAVGLVLAGFRHLDKRENLYDEVTSRTVPAREDDRSAPRSANGFFKSFLDKTKTFLTDDMPSNQGYE